MRPAAGSTLIGAGINNETYPNPTDFEGEDRPEASTIGILEGRIIMNRKWYKKIDGEWVEAPQQVKTENGVMYNYNCSSNEGHATRGWLSTRKRN